MFIVLEGWDAVGKKTQSERLVTHLDAEIKPGALPTKLISFPRYDTPVGQIIRKHLNKQIMLSETRYRDSSDIRVDGDPYTVRAAEDALMFQSLMTIDRIDAAPEIISHLAHGGHVVGDRFCSSAYAYGGHDGIDDAWLIKVHQLLPEADLTILLDLDPEISANRVVERAKQGGKEKDRYETLEIQKSIRKRYHELWRISDKSRWAIVDATGSRDDVSGKIWEAVTSSRAWSL